MWGPKLMEERLRAASLRVRWRLVTGIVGLVIAVVFTLPIAVSQANLGARVSEIWPNSPISEIWPNSIADEIWP